MKMKYKYLMTIVVIFLVNELIGSILTSATTTTTTTTTSTVQRYKRSAGRLV